MAPKPNPKSALQRAIALTHTGKSPYAAAKETGCDPGNLYRALAKLRTTKPLAESAAQALVPMLSAQAQTAVAAALVARPGVSALQVIEEALIAASGTHTATTAATTPSPPASTSTAADFIL